MKKFNIVLCVILTICMLVGCGSANTATMPSKAESAKKLNIVTTIYPAYDWTKNIVGDAANVEYLLNSGVDLHNYQPTAQDILKISQSDVFIYVGGESDEWVEDVLNTINNDKLVAISLSDKISDSLKEEELVEGMQADEHEHEDGDEHEHEDGEEHEDDEEHHHDEEEGPEYDEHIWLSVKNAINCVNAITEAVSNVDAPDFSKFEANRNAYVEKLSALDKKYEDVINSSNVKTLIFADRFPFRYLVDDYGLNYYAAFIGCSAETEASFETISFLAGKVDELGLKYIYKIEGRDDNIAKTVSDTSSSKPAILELDSMQSGNITASYIDIMESNLTVLEKGLKNE